MRTLSKRPPRRSRWGLARRATAALAIALTLAASATPASALARRTFSLKELVARSDAVVHGRIVAGTARWDAAARRPYTYWKVAVDEAVFGGVDKRTIVVKQMGGTIGALRVHVSGNASLRAGEEVVLFLRTDGAFHYVKAMAQGKYAVVPVDGVPRVVRGAASAAVTAAARPLADLLAEVRALRKALAGAERGTR